MAIAMLMTFGAAPASAQVVPVCADGTGQTNTCVAGTTIETKQTCGLDSATVGTFKCDPNADEWHIILNGVTEICPGSNTNPVGGVTLSLVGGGTKTATFVKKSGNACHYALAGSADGGATVLESATLACGGTSFTYGQFNVSHIPCSDQALTPPGVLMCKFYDTSLNGARDPGEPAIVNWEVTDSIDSKLTRPASVAPFTSANLPLPEGCRWFSVTAGQDVEASECNFPGSGWIQTATVVTNDADAAEGIQAAQCDPLNSPTLCTRVDFGNVCLGFGGGKTLGFWSNKNGATQINDGASVASELALLTSLNLVNGDGTAFNPASLVSLQTWLLNAKATNMANMLSAQLAAMALNVEALFVVGGAYVYAPGCGTGGSDFITIQNLMNDADAALFANGNTPAGSPDRATQECLKNALDKANNNVNFVQTDPKNCGPVPVCNPNAIP
jgi:hypothetical protein